MRHRLILLAEDEVTIRNFIRVVLREDGYEVQTAADGAEALAISLAHKGPIDLLLTDVMMPNLNGITAYRKIHAAYPEMKVLFMSGGLPPDLKIPAGCPLLDKPFKLSVLRKTVGAILADPKPAAKVVLAVDHNAVRLERTKKILLGEGYKVLTATTVEEAELLSDGTDQIDLVVSGVIFPGLDGIKLAEHVEVSDRKINTLLISHFHPSLLRQVPGFSRQPEFLQNHFSPEELITRVRQLLLP
jgi:CheY-like chemotaxis protein